MRKFIIPRGVVVYIQPCVLPEGCSLTPVHSRGVQTTGSLPQLSDNTQRRPKPKKGKR